jgi:hypothetical protein
MPAFLAAPSSSQNLPPEIYFLLETGPLAFHPNFSSLILTPIANYHPKQLAHPYNILSHVNAGERNCLQLFSFLSPGMPLPWHVQKYM